MQSIDIIHRFYENTVRMNAPIVRYKLESLSTGELLALADKMGIDVPAGQERILIIEELLKSNDYTWPDKEANAEIQPDLNESAPLSRQYNISYIDVMIRDPLWVFVFWEISGNERDFYEKAKDFCGYYLRVIPIDRCDARETDSSFTVAVGKSDIARYLGFPPEPSPGRNYIIKLCAVRNNTETQIAVSRAFTLPELADNNNELYQNPCILLSGVQDFSVIKSTDRQLRAERQ